MMKLPLGKRLYAWWIVLRETRKLAVMATMPIQAREQYAQKHLQESLKLQALAASSELSAGGRPYETINSIVDAAVQSKIRKYRGS